MGNEADAWLNIGVVVGNTQLRLSFCFAALKKGRIRHALPFYIQTHRYDTFCSSIERKLGTIKNQQSDTPKYCPKK